MQPCWWLLTVSSTEPHIHNELPSHPSELELCRVAAILYGFNRKFFLLHILCKPFFECQRLHLTDPWTIYWYYLPKSAVLGKKPIKFKLIYSKGTLNALIVLSFILHTSGLFNGRVQTPSLWELLHTKEALDHHCKIYEGFFLPP